MRRGLAEGHHLHIARGRQRLQAGRVGAEHPHAHGMLRRPGERQQGRAGEDVEPRGRGHRAGAQEGQRHAGAGVIGLAQVDEAGAVLVAVRDVLDEHVEAGHLRCVARADGRVGGRIGGDDLRRAGGVVADDGLDSQRGQPLRALPQRRGMGPGALHVADRRPLLGGEREAHGHAGQAGGDQVQAAQHARGERLQRLGDPAHDGVFQGEDRLVDRTLPQRLEHLLEAGERHRNSAVRGRRHLAERAGLALVTHLELGGRVGVGILGFAVGDLAQHGWLLEETHSTPTRAGVRTLPAHAGKAADRAVGW